MWEQGWEAGAFDLRLWSRVLSLIPLACPMQTFIPRTMLVSSQHDRAELNYMRSVIREAKCNDSSSSPVPAFADIARMCIGTPQNNHIDSGLHVGGDVIEPLHPGRRRRELSFSSVVTSCFQLMLQCPLVCVKKACVTLSWLQPCLGSRTWPYQP